MRRLLRIFAQDLRYSVRMLDPSPEIYFHRCSLR